MGSAGPPDAVGRGEGPRQVEIARERSQHLGKGSTSSDVRAARLAKSAASDTGDWSPGGLFRPVWLSVVDAVQLKPWEFTLVHTKLEDKSLFLFSKDIALRRAAVRLVTWTLFEWLMLLTILANCVTLAMDSNRPGFNETALAKGLSISNDVFTALFMAEAACKIFAFGFVFGKHTYLHDGWNILDFIVVISGILDFAGLGNYTAIRCLRVLRPLRAITKIPALRHIVQALMRSMPMLVDIGILAAFYYFIFGITTLGLFMGTLFGRCALPNFDNAMLGPDGLYDGVTYNVPVASQQSTSQVCKGPMASEITWGQGPDGSPLSSAANGGWGYSGGKSWGYACPWDPTDNPNEPNFPHGSFCTPWGNPGDGGYWNFDNIVTSWLSIFQHMAVNDWSFIMYATQGALSWWTWMLHVTIVIFGCFFLVNLTLAVIFLAFNTHYRPPGSKGDDNDDEATDTIISARMDHIFAVNLPPLPEDSGEDKRQSSRNDGNDVSLSASWSSAMMSGWGTPPWVAAVGEGWARTRDACFVVQDTKAFEWVTVGIIVLNAICLALTWYDMPVSLKKATDYANYAFTVYFVCEMAIKLTGLGPHAYVADGYNVFDGLVTIVGLIEMAIELSLEGGSPSGGAMSTFRAFRLLRVFRLARSWKSLNRIIIILGASVEPISWLTMLLFLFMFITGLLGMEFFGYKLASCSVEGSEQLCPPGIDVLDCPPHFDCYVPCSAALANTWYPFTDSPYGGQAYCEVFPAGAEIGADGTQYWAQVGMATNFVVNYDNIYQAMLSVFVILTQDDYSINMFYMAQQPQVGNPWVPCLFTIIVMLIGIYMVLNLFLAILLSNLEDDEPEDVASQLGTDRAATHSGSLVGVRSGEWDADADGRGGMGAVSSSSWMPPDLHAKLGGNDRLNSDLWSSGMLSGQPTTPFMLSAAAGTLHDADAINGSRDGAWLIHNRVVPSVHVAMEPPAPVAAYRSGVSTAGCTSVAVPPPYLGYSAVEAGRRIFGKKAKRAESAPQHVKVLPPGMLMKLPSFGLGPGGFGGVAEDAEAGGGESKGGREAAATAALADPMTGEGDGGGGGEGTFEVQTSAASRSGASFHTVARSHRSLPGAQATRTTTTASSANLGQLGLRLGAAAVAHANVSHAPYTKIGQGQGGKRLSMGAVSAAGGGGGGGGGLHASASSMGGGGGGSGRGGGSGAQPLGQPVHPHLHNDPDALEGRSLLLFGPRNLVRMWNARIVTNTWFEYAMLAIIMASCIELCFDDFGVQPGSTEEEALALMDLIFTILFGVEAIMKIVSFGLLFNGPTSYLRSPWNLLDIFVVAVGVLVLALDGVMNTQYIIWLRAFRVFRLLRPMNNSLSNEGLRVVVLCILRSLPAIGEVLLVASLFYFIFAVLAVFLLSGKMFFCADTAGTMLDPYYYLPSGQNINSSWCVGSQTITNASYYDAIGVEMPPYTLDVSWGAHGNLARFDNVYQSLWVLFQMASLENWAGIMYNAMATTGVEQQPLQGANNTMALFFIAFIIFCVFFVLNMVIGVAIDRFDRLKKESGGRSVLLTEYQQEWLTIQRIMVVTDMKKKFAEPVKPWRKRCYRLVLSSAFENFIILVIFTNIVTMCLPHYSAVGDPQWDIALSALNAGYTGIFVIEMLLKWAGLGMNAYFTDGWCQFDFVVVGVSVAGVLVDYLSAANLTFIPLLRVLRVLRVLKLIPKAKGLRMLMMTLLWSLPAFLNVAAVLLLFMFIYSIIGMNLLGAIKLQSNLDYNANFQSFPTAMLLLFRMIVGENWNGVMYDCMTLNDCIEVTATVTTTTGTLVWAGTYFDSSGTATLSTLPEGSTLNRCSPSPFVAALYFCSYMMIMVYLLVQFVIAIILENCEMQSKKENMRVSHNHIEDFLATWEVLDPKGTGFIDGRCITHLLCQLEPPLGIKGLGNVNMRIQAIVMAIDIPIRRGDKRMQVNLLETLHALSGRVAGVELPVDEELEVHGKLVQRLPNDEVAPKYMLSDYYAALYVKSVIKGFLIRREFAPAMEEQFEGQYVHTKDVDSAARWGRLIKRGSSCSSSDAGRMDRDSGEGVDTEDDGKEREQRRVALTDAVIASRDVVSAPLPTVDYGAAPQASPFEAASAGAANGPHAEPGGGGEPGPGESGKPEAGASGDAAAYISDATAGQNGHIPPCCPKEE
ncbi:hypothetical protein FOA52_001002 [Chlamydomonas sp. UWO 241]|nr:hypothetical protein FOA52_001002 [Chlamydomonas sp. UWO 241]